MSAAMVRTARRLLAALGLVAAVLAAPPPAMAAGAGDPALRTAAPGVFAVCRDQAYALCITASCFVLNNTAYCACDLKQGDSISLPFNYGNGKDVCTVNAAGRGNGYVVSTYSVSPELLKPDGTKALYTCPAATSDGAYAQCDGALCFTSTRGQDFPGFPQGLKPGQLICSCPIVKGNPAKAKVGFQIPGPWPCRQDWFKNCTSAGTSNATGSRLYLGAPTGLARALGKALTGSVPPLNVCRQEG